MNDGDLDIGQFVYTSLEEHQTGGRAAGYQVALASSEADARAAQALQARLSYLVDRDQAETAPPERYFFVHTSDGRAVLARQVCRPEPDAYSRAIFLVHGVILTREQFGQAGADPFSLAHQVPFATSLADLQRLGDPASGACGPLAVAAMAGRGDPAQLFQRFDLEAAGQLLLLGLRSDQLVAQSRALVLRGSVAEQLAALMLIIRILPPAARWHTTFDTRFPRDTVAGMPTWAVGVSPPSSFRSNGMAQLDIATGQLQLDAPLEPRRGFETWFLDQLERPSPDGQRLALAHRVHTALLTATGAAAEAGTQPERSAARLDRCRVDEWQVLAEIEAGVMSLWRRQLINGRLGQALGRRAFPTEEIPCPGEPSWVEFERLTCRPKSSPAAGEAWRELERFVTTAYQRLAEEIAGRFVRGDRQTARRDWPEEDELRELDAFVAQLELFRVPTLLGLVANRWRQDWVSLLQGLGRCSEEDHLQFAAWALATLHVNRRAIVEAYRGALTVGSRLEVVGPDAKREVGLLQALAGDPAIFGGRAGRGADPPMTTGLDRPNWPARRAWLVQSTEPARTRTSGEPS